MSAVPRLSATIERVRGASLATRIASLYVAVALAWIWTSSSLVGALTSNSDAEAAWELVKGSAFVLATGGLLYVVLARSFRKLGESQTRLIEANVRLAALAAFPELCPIPVFEFDDAGAVVFQNAAAGALVAAGRAPESILPENLGEILRECLTSGQPVPGMDIERESRHWRWWFFPNEERTRAYAFGREHTHEVALAAQVTRAARMESVGRMAAGIAHDFNNVLTAIGGYSELLERELAEHPEGAADAAAIADEVHRARGLIRQLMMLGRSEPQSPTEIDVNQHLLEIERLVRHLVPRNVDLRLVLCSQPAFVLVDAHELEQAVMNLISNAGDAMPDGGMVTISTEIKSPTRVTLEVRDTGTGIAPSDLPHIFEPFFTTKPAGKGTGLGLASAYGIVKRNGGEIDVETSAGKGTAFAVSLPLTRPAPTSVAQFGKRSNAPSASRDPGKKGAGEQTG